MQKHFGNLLTAMITPFDVQGELDYKKAADLADMLLQNGSDSIVVTGTTGESPTLSHAEEYQLYRILKNAINNKGALIAGTGSNCTRTTINSTKIAEEIGLDGAMIVVPYYNKPSQEGMYQHFKTVAQNTDLPLIIYNIPGRTGSNMLPETTKKLAILDNYIGYKAASGDLEQVQKVMELTADAANFSVYSGDDGLTLPMLELGAIGVISVASHIAGVEIKEMISAYLQNNKTKAKVLNEQLKELFSVLFITANPTPVKAALQMCWQDVGIPRLPLIEATNEEKQKIQQVLKKLGKIPQS